MRSTPRLLAAAVAAGAVALLAAPAHAAIDPATLGTCVSESVSDFTAHPDLFTAKTPVVDCFHA
ncbi:hypothetical protein E1286_31105 [Nonomuraea terrae]|uniref:Uncharacterized protein n=1 Tax=Nonomuraea terrae TaxID=2530383 RepID=A0A4R4YEC2_9ACTN|nr:hypothetical protein [Nonomuraea terrae]TDD42264.1 hypothetical protein E1286_31105 [Nonomuraea terrae]